MVGTVCLVLFTVFGSRAVGLPIEIGSGCPEVGLLGLVEAGYVTSDVPPAGQTLLVLIPSQTVSSGWPLEFVPTVSSLPV